MSVYQAENNEEAPTYQPKEKRVSIDECYPLNGGFTITIISIVRNGFPHKISLNNLITKESPSVSIGTHAWRQAIQ
jgi:hypothetical protein